MKAHGMKLVSADTKTAEKRLIPPHRSLGADTERYTQAQQRLCLRDARREAVSSRQNLYGVQESLWQGGTAGRDLP
jgi:hypothetical protein